MSANCRLHLGHLNSSSSCAAEFRWASSEYRARNALLQRWHRYSLPLNAIWSWEVWYVIRGRGEAMIEPSIARRREMAGTMLRAWTAAVTWCLVIGSWLQFPSICCAKPDDVLNFEGHTKQGIDLDLWTGDALCYVNDYMRPSAKSLVKHLPLWER